MKPPTNNDQTNTIKTSNKPDLNTLTNRPEYTPPISRSPSPFEIASKLTMRQMAVAMDSKEQTSKK